MIVDAYCMDLYCSAPDSSTHNGKCGRHAQLVDRNRTDTLRTARAKGWRFDYARGIVVCPYCVKAGVKASSLPDDR